MTSTISDQKKISMPGNKAGTVFIVVIKIFIDITNLNETFTMFQR